MIVVVPLTVLLTPAKIISNLVIILNNTNYKRKILNNNLLLQKEISEVYISITMTLSFLHLVHNPIGKYIMFYHVYEANFVVVY